METDPFSTSEEDDSQGESSPLDADQQAAWNRIQKERDAARKRADAAETRLAALEAAQREGEVSKVFTQVGLSPKHARLFLKDSPEGEVNEEAVRKWATENDLSPTAAAESTNVSATYQTGPPGVPPPTKPKITEEELDKIMKSDPARGIALANQGLVDWKEDTLQLSS